MLGFLSFLPDNLHFIPLFYNREPSEISQKAADDVFEVINQEPAVKQK